MDKSNKHKTSCTCGHSTSDTKPTEPSSILSSDMYPPILLALLPCGLRNSFQQAILNKFPEYVEDENPKVVIEGNLNYKKVLFKAIDHMTSIDDLPDIFISSDINSLYHKHFLDKFLNSDNFETISYETHTLFKNADYVHPDRLLNWFTTNLLVMLVDTVKLAQRPMPTSWLDILDESYENDLTLRGDADFFCNAMFFPYMKSVGDEAIKKLGKNTAKGLHPSQMVKTLNAGNEGGTTVYVIPYSFAIKVRDNDRFKVLFPIEGAIVSPVQMLIKKGAYSKHKSLVDYILSEELASVLAQSGFPSANAAAINKLPGNSLNWIGWDFIRENDIEACKAKMQQLFFTEFKGGAESLIGEHVKK